MRKFVMLALAIAFSVSTASAKTHKITGWVSDEDCGVKGAQPGHVQCCKKCEAGGTKLVFVSDKGNKILAVVNQGALKGYEGEHIQITYELKDGAIQVRGAKRLEDQQQEGQN